MLGVTCVFVEGHTCRKGLQISYQVSKGMKMEPRAEEVKEKWLMF
jgi:hypothetical protein